MNSSRLETVACPYCGSAKHRDWAVELGFTTVRCQDCRFLYCNPRPASALIDEAVRTGTHGAEAGGLNVVTRRIASKVTQYRRLFGQMFGDVWIAGKPITWLDIGSGFGEVMEAVGAVAPPGSKVFGLEPMQPKAEQARIRGLSVTQDYLSPNHQKVAFVSLVDVFSHIPDFGKFLIGVKEVLLPGGEIFVETGNLADLDVRDEFPGELGLPDHLVFGGEEHLIGFLSRAGFEIVQINRVRIDGIINLGKNVVRKLIGRSVLFRVPYTSRYRQLQIRARLAAKTA